MFLRIQITALTVLADKTSDRNVSSSLRKRRSLQRSISAKLSNVFDRGTELDETKNQTFLRCSGRHKELLVIRMNDSTQRSLYF